VGPQGIKPLYLAAIEGARSPSTSPATPRPSSPRRSSTSATAPGVGAREQLLTLDAWCTDYGSHSTSDTARSPGKFDGASGATPAAHVARLAAGHSQGEIADPALTASP
jgi:hypothetical protein